MENLWLDLMHDVNSNELFASGFYAVLGFIAAVPMRLVSKTVERIPAEWLNRDSSPLIVAFFGNLTCWMFGRYIPEINVVALGAAVGMGSVASLYHRKVAEPLTKVADKMVDDVSAVVMPKEKDE